jgi:Na+-translocating ferredoxin:NAD+ oxidoreductase subunit B
MNGQHHNKGNHHGFGQGQHGKSEGGYCICAQCGYTLNHQPGVPCKSVFCPECNISMVRSEIPGIKSVAKQETFAEVKPELTERKILYPKVVAEKCTACGACIEVCPTDTIVIENGKAFVKIENCRNCKKCMLVCPENAFMLE